MKFLIISLILFFSDSSLAAFKVTIDPGHGGSEKGAVYSGVEESKVALQISKKLFQQLKKDKNFEVQILRAGDSDLTLEERVEKTKNFRPDIFLSIHANAHPTLKNAKGTEFYIQNQLPMEKEAKFLAHNEFSEKSPEKPQVMGDIESIVFDLEKSHRILKSYQVSQYLRKNWHKKKSLMIRQGPFFVLSQNMIPSVLVEVGYLSHPHERKKLTQKSYQNQMARQIVKGLKDYIAHTNTLTK